MDKLSEEIVPQFIKVDGNSSLVRDQVSGAVINIDKTGYSLAISRAGKAQEQRDQIRDTTRDINTLKCEMHEIKNLLHKLVSTK
jgi:hypothetical protein